LGHLAGFFVDCELVFVNENLNLPDSMKNARDKNTTIQIQQIWEEEAGIHLSPEEADSLASNLCAFFDLLIEWDKKETDKRNKSNNER